MARYAQLDSTGVVVNFVEWNGDTKLWSPPDGFTMFQTEAGKLGDHFDGTTFTTPAREAPVPEKSETDALIDLLVAENVISRAKADALRGSRRR